MIAALNTDDQAHEEPVMREFKLIEPGTSLKFGRWINWYCETTELDVS